MTFDGPQVPPRPEGASHTTSARPPAAEIVFNWPGLGTYAIDAILATDYPAIMGITLIGAAGYVLINLAVDLAQAWVDPRIRLT